MAIQADRPELVAAENRLIAIYVFAQRQIDAELAALRANPLSLAAGVRLEALRRRIADMLAVVDHQAAFWINTDLHQVYALGATTAQTQAGAFTQISRPAISRLAQDTMRDLLSATEHVDADVKELIRKVAADEVLGKLVLGRSPAEASKRMATILEDNAVAGATYANAAEVPIDVYASMVIRTKTAVTYNRGTLDATRSFGTEWVEVFDGESCGWEDHDDPLLANGLIVTVDEADNHVVAHPNCRRSFGPRPDIRSADEAAAGGQLGDQDLVPA